MASIEIDFDVFKELTVRRASEAVSYNDVLRDLLDLSPSGEPSGNAEGPGCRMKGVVFPEGTTFRVTYKGKMHAAEIKGGAWIGDDGQKRNSPSEAAHAVTGNNVNGWRFWEAKLPTESTWRKLDSFR